MGYVPESSQFYGTERSQNVADETPNELHLWTFRRQANAVSNGVTIREFQCPLRFKCDCRVGLRTVEGVGYIQLERSGMHHIKSHVSSNNELNDDEPLELVEGSDDEDDLDSVDEKAADDEDDDPGNAGEGL